MSIARMASSFRHTGGLVISSQPRALLHAALTHTPFSMNAVTLRNRPSRLLNRQPPFVHSPANPAGLRAGSGSATSPVPTTATSLLTTLLSALCIVLLLSLSGSLRAADADSWSLSTDSELTREGYFVLEWSLGDEGDYVIQQAHSESFVQPDTYEVPASGSMTLSGFADGDYYFRAGRDGNWTDTVQVTVEHHSLARALGFFISGLLLFSILTVVILRGNSLHNVEHQRRETLHNG